MRQFKEQIYIQLYTCQQQFGGYTGKDLDEIARQLGIERRSAKRNVEKWSKSDSHFAELNYIGKQSIPITLEDIAILNQRLSENITVTKQDLIKEINDARIRRGDAPIPQSNLYSLLDKLTKALTDGAPKELHWLVSQGIKVSDNYNLVDARTTLSKTFLYTNLKTFGGIDIDSIALRLQDAQKWFHEIYSDIDPFKWFFRIRHRSKIIRNHLSRIKADESLSDQARLIFEEQVNFIVQLKDILMDELIHREGRIQSDINANRQKTENRLRGKWIDKYCEIAEKEIICPNEENRSILKNHIDDRYESEKADLELMETHLINYENIYMHLEKITNKFSEDEIIPHHATAQTLLDLCRGKRNWTLLTEEEKRNFTINIIIQKETRCLKAVLTKKLIHYIKKGKITIVHSFKYQDIGKIIESIELSDSDYMVTREDIEKLIEGTYPINFDFERIDVPSIDIENDDFENISPNKIPFQQVQNQVSELVADHNPEWFQSHQEIFKNMTDGMFEMEYNEATFRTKLYQAIGFLGRNLRYSDSPSFSGLQYFIQRYLNDAAIDIEFKHLWKFYEDITGHKTPIIIIDSMGIDSRKKSLFARIHGRYHTIGFADVRAISPYLIPVFSSNCRSTDSEAMNMVEIINQAKSVLGDGFKFCTGDSHTVSRIAAGLAFADHKVILLGRNPNPPKKPGTLCLDGLLKHIELINKIGKSVREDSEIGKIIASREHIFVNDVNVRKILRDLGELILWNSEQKNFDMDSLIQLVETSNRQKRVVRIVERGVTRVTEPNVSMVLKSAELILLMSGIVNILNNKGSQEWKAWSPVCTENIAFFVPT